MTQIRNASMANQAIPDHGRNWGEVYCRVSTTVVASPHLADAHTLTPVNAAAGGAVTLPAAANWPHKMVTYKKTDAGANPVTVSRAGADLIDGAVSVALAAQYDSVTLVSDGVSTWHVMEPAGWGGYTPPTGTCWLYCVANRTTYGGTGAGANLVSPGGDDNTALGYNAMNQNTTGDGSVAVGSYALEGQAGQWVRWNVAVGFQAGRIQGSSEGSAVLVGAYCATASEVYNSVVIGMQAAYGGGLGTSRFGSSVYIGNLCAFDIIAAGENVAVGSNAMYRAESCDRNVCVGQSAGYGTNGSSWDNCVYIGSTAGVGGDTGGDYNVGVGFAAAAGASFTGEHNVYVGASSGGDAVAVVSGDYNVGVGAYSLGVITSGTRLVAVGYSALGDQVTTATDTVAVGFEAGEFQQGSYNVYVGSYAAEGAGGGNTAEKNVVIGFEAGHLFTQTVESVIIGYQAADSAPATTGMDYCVVIGSQAARDETGDAQEHVIIGWQAAEHMDGGQRNVCVGSQSGHEMAEGDFNTLIGSNAGHNLGKVNAGYYNVAVGMYAMYDAQDECQSNVCIGYQAGYGAAAGASTYDGVVAIGQDAGSHLSTGDYNVFVGYESGDLATTGGYNTCIGNQSGDIITTGTYNICLGDNTDPTANNATYELNIGNTLYGDLANDMIGIGTPTPATMLELEITETLTGNVADDYAAAITLDPGYTGAWTVTRHNYMDVQDVSLAGGAAVTNAAVMRFDAGFGAHAALAASFNTTDSNADTTAWAGGVIINVNGTLYKLPAIAI